MSEDQRTFGELLRAARLKAGFTTIHQFADELSAQGILYSDEAIGHWENNRRTPARPDLLQVLGVLAQRQGFASIAAINRLLWLLGWRDLDAAESAAHFALLPAAAALPNLPPRPFDRLVGREQALDLLLPRLQDPAHPPVIVLSGLGGIGKTALAYMLVERLFAAGACAALAWEGLRSEEFVGVSVRPRTARAPHLPGILRSVAVQLGFPALESAPPDTLQARLHAALQSSQVPGLIVLDNLESLEAAHAAAEALHGLVSGTRCRALITSRERLVAEPYLYDHFLPGLEEPASIELVQNEAALRGAEAFKQLDRRLAHRIHTVTGGMPLALKLLVSQQLLGVPVEVELDRLAGAADEHELYRFIYFALWEKLPIPAQQVLAGAAAFGTSAARSMLMRVSQLEEREAFDAAIADLVRAALVQVIVAPPDDQTRYDIHALTRWFVNGPLSDLWQSQNQAAG